MSATFLKHFNSIIDPRIERCKKHELIDILLLDISAVLSGAEGWEDIEDFGRLKLDWLKKYGDFKEGIPWHYSIARVICRLKVDEIERAFQSWIASLVETTGAEIMTIIIHFHQSHFRDFKFYYLHYVRGELKDYFPDILSYTRFLVGQTGLNTPYSLYFNQ